MQQNEPESVRSDPYRIEAVDRALRLLELLVAQDSVTVTAAAAYLGVVPSTAHRLLATMLRRGFVEQGAGRDYSLGPRMAGAAGPTSGVALLRRLMRPLLHELYETVQETVHLTVLVGSDSQFIDGIEGSQTLRVGLRIGARIPAYCTSGGKAMLAQLDEAALEGLHPDGLRPWPGAASATVDELRDQLVGVRQKQYAVNRDESETGVSAVGVAIMTAPGSARVALSVAVPSARFGDERRLAVALHEASAAASLALAGAG